MLYAECIQHSTGTKDELANLLKTQAKLSNIAVPAISIEDKGDIKIGVYSGNLKASGYDIKLHGRLIVGKTTILHLRVIEHLHKFPSQWTVNFLDFFKKIK